MVANEELVSKHQRHLMESQNREHKLVEELEKTKTGIRKYDVELKACKEVIDAANETIVLKARIYPIQIDSTVVSKDLSLNNFKITKRNT